MRLSTLGRWGSLGAVAAGVCCLAASWLSAILTSVGMGLLARYVFLAPLLAVCLGIALIGSWRYSCEQHSKAHLWISLGGTLLLVIGLAFDRRVAEGGMGLLIAASLYTQIKWNRRRDEPQDFQIQRHLGA
jgi:hypothetical protein